MKNVEIDKLDAIFIAKHILGKLKISFSEVAEKDIYNCEAEDIKNVLSKIEKMEDTWSYNTKDKSHTFGRKINNEKIKLWSVPSKSAKVLEVMVAFLGSKTILEIGTSAGYSTLHLSAGTKINNGKVYTIELLKTKIDLAKENFKDAKVDNIELLEGEALKILKRWNYGKIDFVFLDADKKNYGKYLKLLLPLMKKNSIIVADNVNDYGYMMEDYLKNVTGTHLPGSKVDERVTSYYLAALDNGLMITKKL
jgi:predicted O-methyltransferase YrrM